MPVREEGPGVGVWLSLALGAVAGAVLGWPVAGWAGAAVTFVVVAAVGVLLLS